jgi:hypothetical protein
MNQFLVVVTFSSHNLSTEYSCRFVQEGPLNTQGGQNSNERSIYEVSFSEAGDITICQ